MFEKADLFFRLDLPSTLIRQEHGRLFKTGGNVGKRRIDVLVWMGNNLELTELFENKCVTITAISLLEFFKHKSKMAG